MANFASFILLREDQATPDQESTEEGNAVEQQQFQQDIDKDISTSHPNRNDN
ncbi:hypothetical protein ACFQDF_17165 [Ectobacillus funiculus]|uniref:Uncharacterized protein n=1 Tax=Ectobacillus funiculus TaxID=137993 RepID=A0ABV5WGW4_9BACI